MSCVLNNCVVSLQSDMVVCFGSNCAACSNWRFDMATVKIDFNELDCKYVRDAISMKMASLKRAFNGATNEEIRVALQKEVVLLADLSRKFGGV